MKLPESINDVSTLERKLQESGCNPNDYLPTTMQMKFLLHDNAIKPIADLETQLQEKTKKISDLLPRG